MGNSRSPLSQVTAATTEGIDHLQTSALELIAAARSFLDAAEVAVQNPDVVPQVLKLISMLAKVSPIVEDLYDGEATGEEPTGDNVVNIKGV